MAPLRTFPSLDRPVLVMGMPAYPFLVVTAGAGLLLVVSKLQLLIVGVVAVALPFAYLALRLVGQRDPLRPRLAALYAIGERYYRPHAHVAAPNVRIDRRGLLP